MINYVGEEKELKTLRSIEPFKNDPNNKKSCINCGKIATQIAYFKVDGDTVIERYCDTCAESVKFG